MTLCFCFVFLFSFIYAPRDACVLFPGCASILDCNHDNASLVAITMPTVSRLRTSAPHRNQRRSQQIGTLHFVIHFLCFHKLPPLSGCHKQTECVPNAVNNCFSWLLTCHFHQSGGILGQQNRDGQQKGRENLTILKQKLISLSIVKHSKLTFAWQILI